MKESIILLVLFLCCAAFIGQLEINLNPFTIRLPMWHRVVAVLLFGSAIVFWSVGERRDAYSKGLKRGIEETIKQIKNNGDN